MCNVLVDGTDFRIYDPSPFDPKWFCHKLQSPGLRYEVSISLRKGHIVWVHGLYPYGSCTDLTIFRLGMKAALHTDKKVIADNVYRDANCATPENVCSSANRFHSLARARHETCNRRFKQFLR